MGQIWYYSRGENQEGPVPIEQLQELLRTGAIQPDNLVWTEGLTQWTAAQMIPALIGTATAAPVPPSAVAPAMPIGILGYQSTTYGHADYAGFWIRFAAVFIDGLILYIALTLINLPLFAAAGVNYFEYLSGTRQHSGPEILAGVVSFFISVFAHWLYYALQESSTRQATIGKRALGIVVTDMEGQPISFGRATGRFFGKYISSLIFMIGFMMAGWTQNKQALHDMMASTLVVRRQA